MKFLVWSDYVYFSSYGRFHIKMFKKACLRGKEHFNLLILGLLPTGGFFVPHSSSSSCGQFKHSKSISMTTKM
jgi:hypothetical protein